MHAGVSDEGAINFLRRFRDFGGFHELNVSRSDAIGGRGGIMVARTDPLIVVDACVVVDLFGVLRLDCGVADGVDAIDLIEELAADRVRFDSTGCLVVACTGFGGSGGGIGLGGSRGGGRGGGRARTAFGGGRAGTDFDGIG